MQELQNTRKTKRLESASSPSFPSFPSQKKISKHSIRVFTVLFFFVVISAIGFSYAKLDKIEQKYRKTNNQLKKLQNESAPALHLFQNQSTTENPYAKSWLPLTLAQIPSSESSGSVVSVKTVKIRNVLAPYNPSLIPAKNGGYDLFFRYDLLSPKSYYDPFFCSYVGVAHLNDQFEQDEKEYVRLSLHSDYAEDPRSIFIEDQLYLFFNSPHPEDTKCRLMYIANLNPNSFDTNYITTLDLNLQWIEKNWSPFEYIGENGKPQLFIEYQISPRKILALPNPQVNDLKNIPLSHESAYTPLPWASKWGQLRGGTPAKRIGSEYLSFFHSSFRVGNGTIWYVMGAYTFSAEPPFAITRISPYPILFRGIYDSDFIHTADPHKHVIFPTGFVIEKSEDRELIHLACGENDCCIKIVTLDKEKLLEGMTPFIRNAAQAKDGKYR